MEMLLRLKLATKEVMNALRGLNVGCPISVDVVKLVESMSRFKHRANRGFSCRARCAKDAIPTFFARDSFGCYQSGILKECFAVWRTIVGDECTMFLLRLWIYI